MIINYLYQPLVGQDAFLLYQFLLAEVDFSKNIQSEVLTFDRIFQFLSFSANDLDKALDKLVKYNLINFKLRAKNCCFTLQKPLSFSEFSKNDFLVKKLQTKINSLNLESVYFLFWKKEKKSENTFEKEKKHFDLDLLNFLQNLHCLKQYDLKVEDLRLVQHLNQEMKISLEIIQMVMEFCLFKINSFSKKYLTKIITTLKKKGILTNAEKVKSFFQSLYQSMEVKQVLELDKNNATPHWLQKTCFKKLLPSKDQSLKIVSGMVTKEEFEQKF